MFQCPCHSVNSIVLTGRVVRCALRLVSVALFLLVILSAVPYDDPVGALHKFRYDEFTRLAFYVVYA